MKYRKPAIDIASQIGKLKERGLKFADEEKAAHYLSNISYYRLRAYTHPFQDNSNPEHPFTSDITFEEIIELYVFDRRLRLLVFDAVEKIEVALRTKIIYTYSLKYGSHWHEDLSLYRNQTRFNKDINKLYQEVDRSSETFIKHYKQTYTEPSYPPSWMSLEVVSLGLLSRLFAGLKNSKVKKAIAKEFELTSPHILESWMHTFAYLRNICAHHSRLWNRRLTTTPIIPRDTLYDFIRERHFHINKLYGSLCCINYVLNIISPGSSFVPRLKQLISETELIHISEMGFPVGWRQESFWNP